MDKSKLEIEQEKTRKSRKIIIRTVSVIMATAMLAGAGIAVYKLKKGEKLGNGKFYIEYVKDEDAVKVKIK